MRPVTAATACFCLVLAGPAVSQLRWPWDQAAGIGTADTSFWSLQVHLRSSTLGRGTHPGDSLDNYGDGSSNHRVVYTRSEQGRAWEALPSAASLRLGWAVTPRAFVGGNLNLRRNFDAWQDDEAGVNVPSSATELDINEPALAYFHYAQGPLDLQIGRFPVHWSPGPDNGLTLTRSVPYHDALLAGLQAGHLRYQYLASALDPWLTGSPDTSGAFPVNSEEWLQRRFLQDFNSRNKAYTEPVKTLFAHRLAISLSWLEAGFTDLLVVGGKPPSLRDGSPFIFFHNNFGDGYANSAVGFDARVRLPGGATVYGEAFLDDVKEADDQGVPSTLGWMAGAEHQFRLGAIGMEQRLEWVTTAPALYNYRRPLLKLYSRRVVKSNHLPLDASPFTDTYVMDHPLGYFRGGDAEDYWYQLSGMVGRWRGGIGLAWLSKGNTDSRSDLTDEPASFNSRRPLEREFRLDGNLVFALLPMLEIEAAYRFRALENENHRSGNDHLRHQWSAGVGWTLF